MLEITAMGVGRMYTAMHAYLNLITGQQDATCSVYYISVGSSTCSGVDTHHKELVQL